MSDKSGKIGDTSTWDLLLRPDVSDFNTDDCLSRGYLTLWVLDDAKEAKAFVLTDTELQEESFEAGIKSYRLAGRQALGNSVECLLVFDDNQLSQSVTLTTV